MGKFLKSSFILRNNNIINLKSCNMKHLLFLSTLILICSCSSPEDKANELIKKDLRKSLYKPDTYQPVETVIDSAFSPVDSPESFSIMDQMTLYNQEAEKQKFEMESEESSMSLWSGPYQSELGKTEYKQAKRKYDEAKAKANDYLYKAYVSSLDLMDKMSQKKTFIGWKVRHNYRADNNAGNTLIGDMVYIMDKDFENILFSMDAEEYELKHKWFELSGELMNDAKSTFDNLGLTSKEMLHRVDSLIASGHTMMEINEKGIGGF